MALAASATRRGITPTALAQICAEAMKTLKSDLCFHCLYQESDESTRAVRGNPNRAARTIDSRQRRSAPVTRRNRAVVPQNARTHRGRSRRTLRAERKVNSATAAAGNLP